MGNNDTVVRDFVTNSKENLQAWADEEASLREALTEFPSTLVQARRGLASSNRLSVVIRPTLLDLIPGAKRLKDGLIALEDLAADATVPIRDDIRPFTRDSRPFFNTLSKTNNAAQFTAPATQGIYTQLNRLLNFLAYNPSGGGDTQEGFLFWAPWLAHNLNSSINAEDAGGPVRRGISTISCNTAQQAYGVAYSPITQQGIAQLLTAYRLAQLPPPTNPVDGGICPNVPPATP